MVNYENGKIYKIVCNITGLIYVGSTAEILLSNRLARHRTDYRNYLNGKYHYVSSFEILKNDKYEIILLQTYPCNNKYELKARERFYIESLNCVNKNIPNRTYKEWLEDNKDKIAEYHKQYKEQNKDTIKEYKNIYNKQYYNENKNDIIEKNKEYYENNKEQILEQRREYYENNKNEIKKYQKQYREQKK
jgi:hypothetical protein